MEKRIENTGHRNGKRKINRRKEKRGGRKRETEREKKKEPPPQIVEALRVFT